MMTSEYISWGLRYNIDIDNEYRKKPNIGKYRTHIGSISKTGIGHSYLKTSKQCSKFIVVSF